MKLLNRETLDGAGRARLDAVNDSPVTVLQIGEGQFLRGFVDWMLHRCREMGLYGGSVAVSQPRASGKPKLDALAEQDGLYTLVVRGLENGEPVECVERINVFSRFIDPYSQWERLVALAESPTLQVVVSNTTEAGLRYAPETLEEGRPIASFPGKVAYLLYRRYLAFGGATDKGLLLLPCELLERNGDELQACVLRYADDWGLPEAFQEWVRTSNRFLNSLVDRIVTGYPEEAQAEGWFAEWGYEDRQLDTAEPYHLWAIEGEAALDDVLPFQKAGLNVHWVNDLRPFQQRKVRILNGAHTLMTPLGLLRGASYVRELMERPEMGGFVRRTVAEEIVPTLPYPREEMTAYAATVNERFLNPFIRHRLSDISMNSLSKFKARLLPTLLAYADDGLAVPRGIIIGFAALLRFYMVRRTAEGGYEGVAFDGTAYQVRDDERLLQTIAEIWEKAELDGESNVRTVERLLSLQEAWGRDLSEISGLAASIATRWDTLKGDFDHE